MHAICANQVTCAAPGCHEPGTVAVGCTPSARKVTDEHGREHWLECATTVIEFCERHARG